MILNMKSRQPETACKEEHKTSDLRQTDWRKYLTTIGQKGSSLLKGLFVDVNFNEEYFEFFVFKVNFNIYLYVNTLYIHLLLRIKCNITVSRFKFYFTSRLLLIIPILNSFSFNSIFLINFLSSMIWFSSEFLFKLRIFLQAPHVPDYF